MTLGPVRVMGAGVVVMMCVEEVCSVFEVIMFHFCYAVLCPLFINPNNGMITCPLAVRNFNACIIHEYTAY